MIDVAVRWAEPVLRTYDVADYRRKPDVLRATGMPDIVLMGSSRAKYSLVPEEFEAVTGKTAYNLGIAGTKTVEWLMLARHLFGEHRPRLVVLGINASEVRSDYLPTQAARHLFNFDDLLESTAIDGPSLKVAGGYLRQEIGPLWRSYQRRYELKMWGQERLAAILPKHAQASRELRDRVATPCPPKGYDHPWMHGRQLHDLGRRLLEDRAAVVAASVPEFSHDARALRRLDQLLAWFGQQGIPVVVAYLPNSPQTEERWADVEPRMIEAIDAVCRGQGLPLLRCDQADLPRTNHDFLEEIHVGLPLARRISQRVVVHATALGLLDDQPPQLAASPEPDQS